MSQDSARHNAEPWFDEFIGKWVRTVPCNCQNGYAGEDGHTCERCSGTGQRDIPAYDVDSSWNK
jgi:hypothetical protein